MHRGLHKMLIYTIFVLSLARWTTSPSLAQSQFCEEQFAQFVIRYRQSIDSYSRIADASPDAAGSWITHEVLQSLEYNVRFLLKLSSNFYDEPGWKTAEDAINVNRKPRIRRAAFEPQNQFDTDVCSFIPRLLAFLYMCTNEPSGYVQLQRLHSVLCVELPAMVKQSSHEDANQWTYVVDAKTVRALRYIKQEFRQHNKTTIKWTTEQQFYGATFVRNALFYLNGVDKKRMVTKFLQDPEDSRRKVFGVTMVDLYHERTDGKGAAKLDEETVNELNVKLWLMNGQYGANSETQNETPVPDAVNRLVTRAFKTLVEHAGRNVRERLNDDEWPFDRSDVNNIMLPVALDSLCDGMSLVLVYLADNCSDTGDTEVPFGLYLTLCGDWDGFLEAQCPGTLDKSDERGCALNAIADRLLVNFYRVTGSFFNDGDADDDTDADDDDDDATVQNMRDPNTAISYVWAVFTDLHDIYNGLDDELPVWTNSAWLTGKHFLADECQDYRGHPTCALGERTIVLSENGVRPAAEVLLSEAHAFLLPWHSETRNVFAFHAVLFDHADRTLKEFANRHGAIVSLYLQHVNRPLDRMLSYPLFYAFGWYVDCEQRFYYFLDMPGPRVPRGEWSISDIVLANKNLEGTDNENVVRQDATTLEETAKLAAWAKREFSGIKGLEDLDKFKFMLNKNCVKAVKYVNDIIQIAMVLKIMRKYAEYLHVGSCKQFVHSRVFDLSTMDINS